MIRGTLQTEKYRVPDEVLEMIREAPTKDEAMAIELQWIRDNIDSGKVKPYNSGEATNLWLTVGKTGILDIITGYSVNHFDNGNTQIGIGDSATAALASQTDLLAATNKTYLPMESGYPTAASAASIQFRAKALTSQCNYAWNEGVVKQASSGICWNRSVISQGTKTSVDIWYETVTISIT